jgi:hypothetical protein
VVGLDAHGLRDGGEQDVVRRARGVLHVATRFEVAAAGSGDEVGFVGESVIGSAAELVASASPKCVGRTSGVPGVAGERGGVRDVLGRRAETWVRAVGVSAR